MDKYFINRFHPFNEYFSGKKVEKGQHYLLKCIEYDPKVDEKDNIKNMLKSLGVDDKCAENMKEVEESKFIEESIKFTIGHYGITCINNRNPASFNTACVINNFLCYNSMVGEKAKYLLAEDVHDTSKDPLSATRIFVLIDSKSGIVVGFNCYCFRLYG